MSVALASNGQPYFSPDPNFSLPPSSGVPSYILTRQRWRQPNDSHYTTCLGDLPAEASKAIVNELLKAGLASAKIFSGDNGQQYLELLSDDYNTLSNMFKLAAQAKERCIPAAIGATWKYEGLKDSLRAYCEDASIHDSENGNATVELNRISVDASWVNHEGKVALAITNSKHVERLELTAAWAALGLLQSFAGDGVSITHDEPNSLLLITSRTPLYLGESHRHLLERTLKHIFWGQANVTNRGRGGAAVIELTNASKATLDLLDDHIRAVTGEKPKSFTPCLVV